MRAAFKSTAGRNEMTRGPYGIVGIILLIIVVLILLRVLGLF